MPKLTSQKGDIEHTQRHARLHAQFPNPLYHRFHILQTRLPPAHVPPSSAHAEPTAPILLRYPRSLEYRVYVFHLGGFEAGVVARGLGAVAAVFAAAACFDVHQCAHLDRGGVVEAAVQRALLNFLSIDAL